MLIGPSLVWDLSPLRDSVFGPEDVPSGPLVQAQNFGHREQNACEQNLLEPVEYPYSVERLGCLFTFEVTWFGG